MSTKNIETVKAIYGAFARQDAPAILEHVAEDCDWEYAYGVDHEIPWLVRRRGREGAAAFLAAVGAALQFTRFEVNAVVGDGDVVVALCDLECVVRATGRTIVEKDEPHVWRFDARGRVTRFRHAADTLAQKKALG